jgi:hypothetical protein
MLRARDKTGVLPTVRPIARLKTIGEALADGDLDDGLSDEARAVLAAYLRTPEPTVNERAIAESEGL